MYFIILMYDNIICMNIIYLTIEHDESKEGIIHSMLIVIVIWKCEKWLLYSAKINKHILWKNMFHK